MSEGGETVPTIHDGPVDDNNNAQWSFEFGTIRGEYISGDTSCPSDRISFLNNSELGIRPVYEGVDDPDAIGARVELNGEFPDADNKETRVKIAMFAVEKLLGPDYRELIKTFEQEK